MESGLLYKSKGKINILLIVNYYLYKVVYKTKFQKKSA
jgi:hypothetical protein